MRLIDRIFGKKKPPAPKNLASTLSPMLFNFDTDNLTTPQGQALEGYRNNPYVFRACNLYGVLTSIPEVIVQDAKGEKLDNHPLAILFRKPNPRMSKTQFFKTIGTYMGIFGEAFVYPVWTINGCSRLEIANPMDVTVIETGDGWNPVNHYIINRGTAGTMKVDPDEMIHIKTIDPDHHGARGMSPLVAAKRSVEMQNGIRDWNISTTRNGAKTSIILSTPNQLTDEQCNNLADQLNEKYAGKGNAGKGMILQDGMTASTVGMTAVEMDFIQGLAMGAREVATAYGIGSELLSDSSNKTYSNQIESYKQLVQTTGIPLLQTIYDALTIGLLYNPKHQNAYPGVDRITYDPEQINDITIDKSAMYTAMEQATYLTINEKREKLGYDPINDPMADTPLVNMSLSPLSDMALDNEPAIDDELPYLKGEGTITENLARMEQDKPKASILEDLARLTGQSR